MAPDFPSNPNDFDDDDRISFSKLDNAFIAVDEDGEEYQFDDQKKLWIPTEELPVGAEEAADHAFSAETDDVSQRKRKRLDPDHTSEGPDASAPAAKPKKKPKPPPKPKQNTAVYVTGLPSDATIDEIHDLFSRKGGLIAEEIDSRAPRIKLYKDDAGNFKGDALVVFFKPDSVNMAIMLLDDTDFRFSASGQGEGRIRVQAADSSYKKVQYDQDGDANAGQPNEAVRPRNVKDRQKVIKKTQKLDAKLADWSDEEDERFPALAESNLKHLRMVVLRHMFRIFEIEEDPASLLEIKEDIREECSKLGPVTNVVLYDLEPEGIVTVKFQDASSAAACVQAMNGRPFDGRIVEASLTTGKEKFRKSEAANNDEESD